MSKLLTKSVLAENERELRSSNNILLDLDFYLGSTELDLLKEYATWKVGQNIVVNYDPTYLYNFKEPFVILSPVTNADWSSNLSMNPFKAEEDFRQRNGITQTLPFFVINNHDNYHWDCYYQSADGNTINKIESSVAENSCGAYTLLNIVRLIPSCENDLLVNKCLLDVEIDNFYECDINLIDPRKAREFLKLVVLNKFDDLIRLGFSESQISSFFNRVITLGSYLHSEDLKIGLIAIGIDCLEVTDFHDHYNESLNNTLENIKRNLSGLAEEKPDFYSKEELEELQGFFVQKQINQIDSSRLLEGIKIFRLLTINTQDQIRLDTQLSQDSSNFSLSEIALDKDSYDKKLLFAYKIPLLDFDNGFKSLVSKLNDQAYKAFDVFSPINPVIIPNSPSIKWSGNFGVAFDSDYVKFRVGFINSDYSNISLGFANLKQLFLTKEDFESSSVITWQDQFGMINIAREVLLYCLIRDLDIINQERLSIVNASGEVIDGERMQDLIEFEFEKMVSIKLQKYFLESKLQEYENNLSNLENIDHNLTHDCEDLALAFASKSKRYSDFELKDHKEKWLESNSAMLWQKKEDLQREEVYYQNLYGCGAEDQTKQNILNYLIAKLQMPITFAIYDQENFFLSEDIELYGEKKSFEEIKTDIEKSLINYPLKEGSVADFLLQLISNKFSADQLNKFFFNNGLIDPDLKSKNLKFYSINGDNLLIIALEMDASLDTIKMLLASQELDVNQANKNGLIPLYLAAIKGQKEIVSALLKNNADPKLIDSSELLANQNLSTIKSAQDIIRLLVAAGMPIDDDQFDLNSSLIKPYQHAIKLLKDYEPRNILVCFGKRKLDKTAYLDLGVKVGNNVLDDSLSNLLLNQDKNSFSGVNQEVAEIVAQSMRSRHGFELKEKLRNSQEFSKRPSTVISKPIKDRIKDYFSPINKGRG